MLTGALWLLPPTTVPPGTWLFGVAVILVGVNVARYIKHIAVSSFSVVVGIAAFVAAVSQLWRTDPPLGRDLSARHRHESGREAAVYENGITVSGAAFCCPDIRGSRLNLARGGLSPQS
jgi:hypothetical protein